MKYSKYITIRFEYTDEKVWDETQKEVEEIMSMFNNLSRRATLVDIEQGMDKDGNDGRNE
jgi:hypothetical protein|tara:strand:+ start:13384 stop:13563 length:180 start_codon:yes stop_codon:yes gene_type:complete